MTNAIKAFFIGVKIAFAENMAYRADFFTSLFVMFFLEFFFPIVSVLIYNSGASFPGWSLYQVLLVQGAFILAKGFAFPLFIGMYFSVMSGVRSGTLDTVLLRPRSALFTLALSYFNVHDTSKILSGIIIIIFAAAHVKAVGVINWFLFTLMIILSVALIFSFILLMCVYTVKFVGSNSMLSLIEPVTQFGQYPRRIFSEPIRIVVTNIFPVAMIGFYPASVLMGTNLSGLFPALLTTVCFIALSLFLWKRSLSKYTSAGG